MISDLISKMRQSPDRGTPCLWCDAPSKDCQITYIEESHRCCASCDEQGGALSHPNHPGVHPSGSTPAANDQKEPR